MRLLLSVIVALVLLSYISIASAQSPEQFEVKDPSGNQSYQVGYSITGGTIQNITINPDDSSLMVDVSTTDGGSLTMSMPRSLIDAKSGNADDQFIVLVDGADTDFNETSTTTSDRTVSIGFPAGTEQIEVIGTQVVPEFGELSVAILIVSILITIAFSTKNRLKLGFGAKV